MAAGYHDFTAGEVLTAANLEDYCQNQSVMRFASTSARDTALSSVKTAGMYAISTDLGRLWVYDGTTWRFVHHYLTGGRPGVVLTDSAQSISVSSTTDITWGTEVEDVDGWTSGGSATLTVPAGWEGKWRISLYCAWASSPTTSSVAITINGSSAGEGPGGAFNRPCVTLDRTLAASDTIKCQAFQTSGGAINLDSRLEISWIGR